MAGTSKEHGHEVLKNLQIAALLSTLGGQRIVWYWNSQGDAKIPFLSRSN